VSLVRRFYATAVNERFTKLVLILALVPIAQLHATPLPIDQSESGRQITYAMIGEDATSTHYYFFYSLAGADTLSKVRLLWNGGAQNKPSVTDYYLDGSSILVIERSASRESLPILLTGEDTPFQFVSERRFRSVAEDTLLGVGESGRLTKEERLALSNLIHALSLIRKPLPTKAN
jgi:hypothetical protein